MFSLVNDVVYHGLMIPGTRETPDPADWFDVPGSAWIGVGGGGNGHVRHEEMAQLKICIEALTTKGVPQNEIFVLSPFRQVADALEEALAKTPGIRHGTVHTAQGREADVVLFVLGGDPAHPGAQQWAAEKPNLYNVAVSRARKRLYVIGDQSLWGHLQYFSALASRLPRNAPWSNLS